MASTVSLPTIVRSSSLGLALALVAATAACTVGGESPPPPIPVDGGVSQQAYPTGPYGINVGTVIRNYEFSGYVNPAAGVGPDHRAPISLGDFYNPTGDETYPVESSFPEGEAKPRALVINVSAVWCGPCQHEAAAVLPEKHAEFGPRGATLLLDLADGVEPGVPGSFSDLDNWTTTFPVDYPAVVDPTYQLGALFDSSSFPANIIVDTADMTIVEVIAGVPEDSFWKKLGDLLGPG